MQIPTPSFLAQFGTFEPPVKNNWNDDLLTTTGTLDTLDLVISSILGLATVVGGLLFVFTFIQGAIGWIGAGGDAGKITKARDQMLQGVIGLIILVASYAIIGLVGSIVGITILTPAAMIEGVLPTNR